MYNQKLWLQHPIDTRQNSIYYYPTITLLHAVKLIKNLGALINFEAIN